MATAFVRERISAGPKHLTNALTDALIPTTHEFRG